MKLYHAAALVSVGWYLMMPPTTSNGEPDLEAPLSEWEVNGSYPTAQACDKQYQADVKSALEFGHMIGHKDAGRIQAEECLATDDPRLAK
jgi:hypothetical protein